MTSKLFIDEAQYIRDMKTVGVPEKDFEWHLALYRKTEELRKNANKYTAVGVGGKHRSTRLGRRSNRSSSNSII